MPMNIGSSEWQFCLDVVLRKSQSREILNVDEQRLENAFDCQPRIEVNTTFLEHRPRVKVWKPQPKKPNEKKGGDLQTGGSCKKGPASSSILGRERGSCNTRTPTARVVLRLRRGSYFTSLSHFFCANRTTHTPIPSTRGPPQLNIQGRMFLYLGSLPDT